MEKDSLPVNDLNGISYNEYKQTLAGTDESSGNNPGGSGGTKNVLLIDYVDNAKDLVTEETSS